MRIVHQQTIKVLCLVILYAAITAYFQVGFRVEQHQLQKESDYLTEQQRGVQHKLNEERIAVAQNEQKKRYEQHYADWRADLELLDFAASFASGVTLLERDGDRASFVREFYTDDHRELTVTKDAVRELLYWGFNRLSITNDNALKRGSWLLNRRR